MLHLHCKSGRPRRAGGDATVAAPFIFAVATLPFPQASKQFRFQMRVPCASRLSQSLAAPSTHRGTVYLRYDNLGGLCNQLNR